MESTQDGKLVHWKRLGRVRPRFSLRTFLLLVALIPPAYFACWDATKRYATDRDKIRGGGQVGHEVKGPDGVWYVVEGKPPPGKWSPAPFLVFEDDIVLVQLAGAGYRETFRRRYHVWLVGVRLRLPYESSWTSDAIPLPP